ncbi:MAG TPA: S8 family serine peptidase [Nocardioidaceae bacterium]|nr:S8 family serine peptidase [Nocardioidaceae bacterium]
MPSLAASPAQAGLLDSLTDPVSNLTGGLLDPVTDPVTGLVTDIAGGLLGTSGWLYDNSETSMTHVRSVIGADSMWSRGYTGQGVGVALVDTGVVPVKGLTSGNVVNGADLSFESQSGEHRHYDTFGHGTHMAGIIAGDEPRRLLGPAPFQGVAPDAKLTSIKVAAHDGAADVSQVIAAIDWVVEHRNDDPRNPIRVLNLSYGTDGVQDYRVDPLTHAVENAWRAGIVVVVSGGNEGFGHTKLNNPAYDPHVLTVGAADTKGTRSTRDDTIPEFSSRGDAERRVDVTAPGRSIVSLRDPGSYLDTAHPKARVDDRFFKGSGSSQAAAVVSGAVALLLEQRPSLTPDQVKALLRSTAAPMPNSDAAGRGAGEIDLDEARITAASSVAAAAQPWPRSTGTGSLELARGTQHVADQGVALTGERDILAPWDAKRWAAASSAGTAWQDGYWNGTEWTGDCWCGSSWTARSWSARSWSARSWSGDAWAARSWSARSWSARSWSGDAWAARSWSARSWSGDGWN